MNSNIKNVDLWKLISRVLDEYKSKDLFAKFVHVPAHVGIYGNERADRLAKAAVKRAISNSTLTSSQQHDRWVENQADAIVAAVMANL